MTKQKEEQKYTELLNTALRNRHSVQWVRRFQIIPYLFLMKAQISDYRTSIRKSAE